MAIVRRGKAWRVVVYAGAGPDGQEIRLTETVHGTKQQAKDREGELRKKARAGLAGGARATVDQLLDQWLAVARHEASTRTRTDSYLSVHVRPVLGTRPVTKVTTNDLDRLYLTLEETLAPATVRRVHGIIRAAFEQAVVWGWIDRNPAARARLPEVREQPPNPPDVEQVRHLLAVAEHDDPALFVFMRVAAVTGMRKGEVCALRRGDLDLEAGIVRRASAIGEAKGGAYLKATKTRLRDTLSVDPETCGILTGWLERQNNELADFGPFDDAAFLFSNDPTLAVPWRPDHVSKRFARVRDKAGLPGVQIRELRHFNATALSRAGFSPRTVATRLGHSRPSTTMNRYGADAPPDDVRASEHVADLL